jgi:iron complex transport system ATP-binding protein
VTPLLTAEAVSAGFPGRPVLHDITLAVRPGEACAVVGPNGSGKSTLLKVLAGQLPPSAGRVRFEGADLATRSAGWVAARIARSPQVEVSAWPATVEEAVTLGRAARRGWLRPYTAEDREVVARCLADADLTALAARVVTELSAGESQRVLIARALAQEPKVLLLDEPTSHLDLKHQVATLDLCRRLARELGLAVGVVLHDLGQAANWCDRAVVLSSGRVVGDGRPRDVFTPDLLSRVYDFPVRVVPDGDQLLIVPAKGAV